MEIERAIISPSATLFAALEALNRLSGDFMTLLVVDHEGRLKGTLTDGDVRRALLRGVSLQSRVTEAMHKTPRCLRQGEDATTTMKEFRRLGLELVPVVDSDGRLLEIVDLRKTPSRLPLSAILMAGGRGERLRPLTLTTPKPLLKVGEKAIIDYNIEALAGAGIKDISVTVNYLAEQLEEHFSMPVGGVRVKTIRETMPLGTIGAASLVQRDDPDGTTLVMNSDLLTSVSFEEMYLTHRDDHNDITIAAKPYNISIPYAILSTEDDTRRVTGLREKPEMSYYANAGIYMISNRLLDGIPSGRRIDATDLIEEALASGCRVGYYPLNGTWIDIGSPADYRHACDLISLKTNI